MRGVRVPQPAEDSLNARLLSYRVHMENGEYFSHVTAARLYEIPLPRMQESTSALHVSVHAPDFPPRVRGVIGHRLFVPIAPRIRRGFPVVSPARTWTQLAAIQLNYNLTERTAERELLPMASDLGLSVAVWGALAGGVLSGKYRRGKPAGEGRLSDPTFRDRGLTERNHDIVDVLIDVAAELDATPAQAALSWLRAQSPLLIPIVGARTSEQLRGNLKGLSITLSDDHRRRLDDVSRPVLGFPHDFLASPAISSLVEGQFGQRLRARRRGSF